MRASSAFGGRSRSQSSQFGRSSSTTRRSAHAAVGGGPARLAEREALVPRHVRLVDAAESGVRILVGDEVLDLVPRVAVVAGERPPADARAGAGGSAVGGGLTHDVER